MVTLYSETLLKGFGRFLLHAFLQLCTYNTKVFQIVFLFILIAISIVYVVDPTCTGLGERAGPRLRELAPRGQRESGGGIHAT